MESNECTLATRINTFPELPEFFKEAYDEELHIKGFLPINIHFPRIVIQGKSTLPKLITLYKNNLIYFEKQEDHIHKIKINIKDIQNIEQTTIQSCFCMRIEGVGSDGLLSKILLLYYSEAKSIIEEFIRHLTMNQKTIAQRTADENSDFLQSISLGIALWNQCNEENL